MTISSFFGLLLLVALANANIIKSTPHNNWGEWGPFENCPSGEVARDFQLKCERSQGNYKDDSALNAIRLFCGNPSKPDTRAVTSMVGKRGNWDKVSTCYPGVLTGFQLRVEEWQYSGDDTGSNNIRFWCNKMDGNPATYIEGDAADGGGWTEIHFCDSGMAICGIQSQIDNSAPYDDNTGMNNVIFACCYHDFSSISQ